MSEFRQDPVTKQWVIIATERAKRPHDFAKTSLQPPLPAYKADCPFCEGNEHLTPLETLAYRHGGQANGPGWWIRAIPNKFAAVSPSGSLARRQEEGFFRKMDGVGQHEVIIESPQHNLCIPLMGDPQVEEIVRAYRERYLTLREDPRFKIIIIFKNHGRAAGTSLEHPHAQLVAMPIVPLSIRYRFEKAAGHYDDSGTCVYCDVLKQALQIGKRIIMENEQFVVLHPFASRAPFETWILPKEHQASFGSISLDNTKKFAKVLKATLGKFYRGLNNPDYNYIIHTAPLKDEHEDYFHWHLQILPRLVTPAGFELGTGMFINTALPEETAAFMRNLAD
ncbi:MAG: galactose-1-phosphate uridylyltransferase [Deltaproteobacteria bacterium]|nr:galactose-1-phosphate uridylyltransferase [Deltaproteobacteria bacterium]